MVTASVNDEGEFRGTQQDDNCLSHLGYYLLLLSIVHPFPTLGKLIVPFEGFDPLTSDHYKVADH